MSISSAMYAAVTGLSALSTGMQVISNNIANVNTVGFKAGRTNFEDLISQDYWSNGKTQQIGRGVKVSTIQQMFTQGSFISSAVDTDMAITGDGFFQVRDRVTGEIMYTRAGNFTTDKDGNLETPAGYILQGWELSVPKPGEEPKRMGVPQDVKIVMLNAPPLETSQIKVVCNLNADDTSAFIYPEEGWAEIYADQVARPPAELIGQLASDAVYSAAIHGSAYPTYNPTSLAFNQAYENYMTQVAGYTAGTGAFLPTPTSAAIAAAAASAYAAAQSAVPVSALTFSAGFTSSSKTFRDAFTSAFVNSMSASGFSHFVSAGGNWVFYVSASAAFAARVATSANSSVFALSGGAVARSGYPPQPPFDLTSTTGKALNSAYVSAYHAYMSSSGYSFHSAGLTETFFYLLPSASTIASASAHANTSAKAAYLAITNPGNYPSNKEDTVFDNAYNAKFLDKMSALGYTYQGLSFSKTPSATEIAAALALGKSIADANTPQIAATYPANSATYKSPTYRNAFDSTYVSYMASSGFYLSAGTNTFKKLPTQATSTAANQAALTAIGLSASATSFAGYPASSTTFASATSVSAYNSAYAAYMNSHGGYTWNTSTNQFIGQPPSPSQATIEAAREAAHAAGVTAYNTLPLEFPSVTADEYYNEIINTQYDVYLKQLGYELKNGVYTKTPSDIEKELARQTAYSTAKAMAGNAYQAAFNNAYQPLYDLEYAAIQNKYPPWQLEGNGFAGAWDATNVTEPISPENYTHANPWTIYDTLGNAHTLMVYYQPNPHMENVWDYIITCDPTEDARKDINNRVLMEGASFAGLIQKGKITFTADGPDGHGGLIKDIEAQNIDLTKTEAARLTSAVTSVANQYTANSLNSYKLGGYYEGSPVFSAVTGSMVASNRTYTITWRRSLGSVPDVSGFVWTDSDGGKGTIPVYDMNYTGPYTFGSGLTINFTSGGTPMRFTSGDTLKVNAKSESIGWTNLTPNAEGYFDFDVAFVQSASMANHPPYPEGLPTIIQHISLDMGAKNPNGNAGAWILDEQGTTQYASESLNIFSSQDGYPAGSLQRISIDKDGILTGVYTNGRQQPLFQIGLARFLNPWGLEKLGDNVYQETRWSGVGTINPPGFGGTGTIRANFLEQSNVDLADEIVNMIVTQRGFQANSKVVTTTDTMLAEVIEMKR
ncbi:MAG: flagellar hook-basal body complex protein [Deltaproteobacteria bacterium]|jgi:flagellar hook-basal body protein|nr:flagellar hook-basal body complex protein [Deltaproteobacteria bacterium]